MVIFYIPFWTKSLKPSVYFNAYATSQWIVANVSYRAGPKPLASCLVPGGHT